MIPAEWIAEVVALVIASLILYFKSWRKLEKQHLELSEKIESVASRANGFFDVLLDSMPFPAWVKSCSVKGNIPEFRMHFCNRAYEDMFNKSRTIYIGKTDYDMWPREIADRFYYHDLEVLRAQGRLEVTESTDGKNLLIFKKVYLKYKDKHWILGFCIDPAVMCNTEGSVEAAKSTLSEIQEETKQKDN